MCQAHLEDYERIIIPVMFRKKSSHIKDKFSHIWVNPVLCRTNLVIIKTNPFRISTSPVILRTNSEIFRTNQAIRRTNPIIFHSSPSNLVQRPYCPRHLWHQLLSNPTKLLPGLVTYFTSNHGPQ